MHQFGNSLYYHTGEEAAAYEELRSLKIVPYRFNSIGDDMCQITTYPLNTLYKDYKDWTTRLSGRGSARHCLRVIISSKRLFIPTLI